MYFPEVKTGILPGGQENNCRKQFTGLYRRVFCEKNISDTLIVFGFRVSEGPEVTGIYDGYPGLYENRMKQPDCFSVSDVINRGGVFP